MQHLLSRNSQRQPEHDRQDSAQHDRLPPLPGRKAMGGHADDDGVVAGKNDVDQQNLERGLQQRAIH